MRVDGKVVVVTGAARGQGRAAAEHLAREGAVVWATDVAEPLQDADDSLTHARLDVTSPEDWRALAAAIAARDGRVDALVNNAGIPARGRLPDVDLDEWRHAFDVNATGPLLGMQTLAPLMAAGS
ncbi:MAG TPA: SDR family NAD(P)-dependent oxidoreductase, partial [Pseudolysinimonas sp.]